MSTAAIIGAGLIGRAWAMVFARAGWRVNLYDSASAQLASAHGLIEASLGEQARAGLVRDAIHAISCISIVERLDDALAGAAWVQENLPEDVAVKRGMFAAMDSIAPGDAILASSTSGIRTSLFTEELAGRARCLVAHPVNPPHLIPVVEISGAPWTSQDAIERACAVMSQVRQVPVVVKREIDGFIVNRLQGALLNEAMRLVGEGYVSAEDLDKTVAHGLGLRWSFMGPLATIELNAPGGVADYAARYSSIYRTLAADPPSPQVWNASNVERVAAGFGEPLDAVTRAEKMAWRDGRLLALSRHKSEQQND